MSSRSVIATNQFTPSDSVKACVFVATTKLRVNGLRVFPLHLISLKEASDEPEAG